MRDYKTTTSIVSSAGLALLTTTCCALPITLIALGMGGVVASMASTMPWISTLFEYKLITFSATTLVLTYSWWRVRHVSRCEINDEKILRFQKIALSVSTALFLISVVAAFALYPLAVWLDGQS